MRGRISHNPITKLRLVNTSQQRNTAFTPSFCKTAARSYNRLQKVNKKQEECHCRSVWSWKTDFVPTRTNKPSSLKYTKATTSTPSSSSSSENPPKKQYQQEGWDTTFYVHRLINQNKIDEAEKLVGEMKEYNIQFNHHTYYNMLKLAIRKKDPSQFGDIFTQLKESNLPIEPPFFNLIIKYFATAGPLNQLQQWFEEMKLNKVAPSIWTFNYLIHGHIKFGTEESLVEIFSQMKELNLVPSVSTFGVLFEALRVKNDPKEVFRWYDRMKEFGVQPDVKILNSMLVAVKSDPNAMVQIFSLFEKEGVPPNNFSYSTMLLVFSSFGNKRLFDEYVQKLNESNIEYSIYTWTALVKGCSSRDQLIGILHEMKKQRVKPDTMLLNATIVALLRLKYGMDETYDIIRSVLDLDIANALSTYNVLLNFFGEQRDWESLRLTTRQMSDRNVKIDTVTLCTVGSHFARVDKTGKLFNYVKTQRAKGTFTLSSLQYIAQQLQDMGEFTSAQMLNTIIKDLAPLTGSPPPTLWTKPPPTATRHKHFYVRKQ